MTWGDLAVLEYGKALRGYRKSATGSTRVYGTNGPIGWTEDALGPGPAVVVGRKGAYRGVHYASEPFWVIDTAYWLRPLVRLNPRWAYYQLLTQDINGRDSGSAIPSLSRSDFYSLRVDVPPLVEQEAIAEVLGALDDKIDVSNRIAAGCRELALALFDEAIRIAGVATRVDDVAEFHNRLRVPLSSRQRAERPGSFAYLGAAGVLDHINGYLFDGIYVLVGEDGTVTADGQHPLVQYVWGKFWVSNHAHVLTGKGVSTEVLRCALTRADVLPAITGAVQPKLSMGNLKGVELSMPAEAALLEPQLGMLAAAERAAGAEADLAAQLRNVLLPPLLSGELRVHDAEARMGEAV